MGAKRKKTPLDFGLLFTNYTGGRDQLWAGLQALRGEAEKAESCLAHAWLPDEVGTPSCKRHGILYAINFTSIAAVQMTSGMAETRAAASRVELGAQKSQR